MLDAIGLLITVVYFLIGSVFDLYLNTEEETSIWVMLFWPIIVVVGIACLIKEFFKRKGE